MTGRCRGEDGRNVAGRPESWASSAQKVSEETFSCTLAIRDESSNIDLSLDSDQTIEALRQLTDSLSLISGSSEESRVGGGDPGKLGVKKPRPKASSPNRQGPQQCQVCGKVFNNASALTKHKLTHSDERKYVCTMCGKAFKRQDHLNGHMLTHRNKKPYECKAEGCGKSYCDARSLRRHTENHHAGSKVNESVSPSSPTTGPHTPNTPGSNPSTPSTPGATSTTNGHGHAALKQLLATEPAQTQQQKTAFSRLPGMSRDFLTGTPLISVSSLSFNLSISSDLVPTRTGNLAPRQKGFSYSARSSSFFLSFLAAFTIFVAIRPARRFVAGWQSLLAATLDHVEPRWLHPGESLSGDKRAREKTNRP
ncbi:hypothetical protein ACFW04_010801 [Cataglyphis niger]